MWLGDVAEKSATSSAAISTTYDPPSKPEREVERFIGTRPRFRAMCSQVHPLISIVGQAAGLLKLRQAGGLPHNHSKPGRAEVIQPAFR